MKNRLIVVDGSVATEKDHTDLREDPSSLALDQRAFGPGRILVAFADLTGRLISLAYSRRTQPLEAAPRTLYQAPWPGGGGGRRAA